MKYKNIVCCCGNGLGSSMMVSMNIEKVLKNLGISGISVSHTTLSEIPDNTEDLLVVGSDLAVQVKNYKHKIILDKLMDMKEIEDKLIRSFDL